MVKNMASVEIQRRASHKVHVYQDRRQTNSVRRVSHPSYVAKEMHRKKQVEVMLVMEVKAKNQSTSRLV